ncbi:hypothetical protein [Pseudobacteroides cellulosolvens]|uniref:Peptidase M10A and M12B matrixin and adamalysin n=1 Tax=Pseudobacteroides cellulosolvens ATCC 35603 = DSM 2933 TaxID=398512 RepID=A0A0L6JXL9_9FIRM|nr:hypothetical protein [Pseudobacteroides cellulosolvens]KNY30601.1 hypothetical protein Bccel_5881 [Pseudobacteroides cellulosolvens ATCC 35603 = DSM 2933]
MKLFKNVISFAMIFIFTTCFSINVSAYEIEGIPKSRSIYYSYHSSLSSTWRTVVENARITWNNASGNVKIYRNSTDHTGSVDVGDNKNTVTYADVTNVGYPISVNAATPLLMSGEIIENFDVIFNTNQTWGSGDSFSYKDRQGIATHELGHVIGIGDYNWGYGPYYWTSVTQVATMYGYSEYGLGGNYLPCSYYLRTLQVEDKDAKLEIASLIN